MPRSQLPVSTTPHTAHPMADSISRLEEVRLAHGLPKQMTFISGYKWILGKKWKCRQYKVKEDKTVISGSKAILFPTVMTGLPSQRMPKTGYVENTVKSAVKPANEIGICMV